MSRILFCLAVIITIFLSPDGYGKETKERQTELILWNIPTKDANVPERQVYVNFIRTHPDIKIVEGTGIRLEGISGGDTRLLMGMASNTAPDVIYVNFRFSQTYIDQGFLYPLNEFITEEDRNWMDSWLMPSVRHILSKDGRLYAIPYFYVVEGLYYRKDMFTEAGLDPYQPPQNWDELYKVAQRLTFPEKSQYGIGIPTGEVAGWKFLNYIWQAGGEVVRKYKKCGKCFHLNAPLPEKVDTGIPSYPEVCTDCGALLKDAEDVWKCVFNEHPGVQALNFYKKLRWSKWARCPEDGTPFDIETVDIATGEFIKVKPQCPQCGEVFNEDLLKGLSKRGGIITGVALCLPLYEDLQVTFLQRRLGMHLWQTAGDFIVSKDTNPELVGVAPMPAGPGGMRANCYNAGCYGINAQIRDPAKRRAAWEFIKYMASDDARRIRVKSYVETGLAHTVNPVYLKKFGYEEYLIDVPQEWIRTHEDLQKTGRPEPYAKGFMNVQSIEMAVPIDAVLFATADEIRTLNTKALLDACVKKSNDTLLGFRDPKVIKRRRQIGNIVVVFAFLILIWVCIKTVKLLMERYGIDKKKSRSAGLKTAKNRHITAWLFMFPALITILIWEYYPLTIGSILAFFDYQILGSSKFVWLDNFIEAFYDPRFWASLVNTFYYVALTIGLGFFVPIICALFLAEVPRGKYLFRTLLYLPAVTSGMVILFLWKQFYFPTETGFLNDLLGHVGLGPYKWLSDPKLAMLCVVLPGVWAGAGPGSIIYLAAMKTIPEELYESAEVDGAGVLSKIWHITIPTLKPLIIINFVGAFIGSFHAMGNILAMTGGGPRYATNVIGMEIWRSAFMFLKFGYAIALAWILGFMLIGFTVYQLQILKKVEFHRVENI